MHPGRRFALARLPLAHRKRLLLHAVGVSPLVPLATQATREPSSCSALVRPMTAIPRICDVRSQVGNQVWSETALDDAFFLALAWSPVPRVHVDHRRTHRYVARDLRVGGKASELGPRLARSRFKRPDYPVAVPLHDQLGQLRLLVLDFDDHARDANPVNDAHDVMLLLDQIGCPYVYAASSRTGLGRHLWIYLTEAMSAVRQLNLLRALVGRYRTLDLTPLQNMHTGCVRHPGAAHREGGHSEILRVGVPPNSDATAVFSGASRAPRDIDQRLHAAIEARTAGEQPAWLAGSPKNRHVVDCQEISSALHDAAKEVLAAGCCPLPAIESTLLAECPTAASSADHVPLLSPLRFSLPPTTPPTSLSQDNNLCAQALAGIVSVQEGHLPIASEAESAANRDLPDPASKALKWRLDDWNRLKLLDLETHLQSLPQHVQNLLNPSYRPLPGDDDASAVQFRALVECVRSGWTFDTVYAFERHFSPFAFTHSRSVRSGSGRRPRTQQATRTHLLRQYRRASRVAHIAAHGDIHRDSRSLLLERVIGILDRADTLNIGYTRTHHTTRRVLEAHLARALASNSSEYYAGTRDLAADCGVRSPQTALTETHRLVRLGLLEIAHEGQGRLANQYRLCFTPPPPKNWTQGEPAPGPSFWGRVAGGLRLVDLGEVLRMRTRHFRHDVWLSAGTGAEAALVAFHLAQSESADPDLISARSGLPTSDVRHYLLVMTDLGLVTGQGKANLTSQSYRFAADRSGTAGLWHRQRVRWRAEQKAWDWWCAETEFLSANCASTASVAAETAVGSLGRYPRKPGKSPGPDLPDHAEAQRLMFLALAPSEWEAE